MRKQGWSIALALVMAVQAASAASLFAADQNTSEIFVAGGPGDYQIIDRSRIETAIIDWSKFSQEQDQQMYTKAADESYAAYLALYGTCADGVCTGFQGLRQIHLNTVVTKKGEAVVDADVLAQVISDYIEKRDTFLQKIAAIEVAKEVWSGLASTESDQKLLYSKGALNLTLFAGVYRDAIAKMDKAASDFTYRYRTHMGVAETQKGMGLEMPMAYETPESLRAKNADFQERVKLTQEEIEKIGLMSIEFGRHMLGFVDTNAQRLYWYNDLQESDKQDWIESVQTKARILKWMRAVYCMRIGVPALHIPRPSSFNLDYLKRGVPSDSFRIVQKAEWNEDAIRKTLSRFDQVFVSTQSQTGEFDNEGGVWGFLNRVNSTFTWHNEVHAYMNIMYILRDNMIDELDLSKDLVKGCEKVRERYYARYGSLKDSEFTQTVSSYLEGLNYGGAGDALQKAFAEAGSVITAKGGYMRELRKFLKEHPGATLIQKTLSDADDLR